MSPESDEFKCLALDFTASLSKTESEQSLDELAKLLKGNALTLICGGPHGGKSRLLAHLMKLAKGQAYFIEEGDLSPEARRGTVYRTAEMRDCAITLNRPSYLTVPAPRLSIGQLERYVLENPALPSAYADAAVYLTRIEHTDAVVWSIIKNRAGIFGPAGKFRVSDIADERWYRLVMDYSRDACCSTITVADRYRREHEAETVRIIPALAW